MMQSAFKPTLLTAPIENALDPLQSGIPVESIALDEVVEVRTQSRTYTLKGLGGKRVVIEGHPQHCPQPLEVTLIGSTWGGSLLRPDFVCCGMHLEYLHPMLGLVRTSRIRDIERHRPTRQ
jgi:hypothetical protein